MINEENLLKKILYSSYLRNKFLKYEENKELFYGNDKEELIKRLIEQIKKEINDMNESTFDINLVISWYKCLLEDYYMNDDPYLVFNDSLKKLIQNKLLAYNVDVSEYTEYTTEMQLEALNNNHNKYLYKYLEYKKLDYMTDDEFERYVYALNELNCYQEEDYFYIINMILDKNYKLSDETYKKFFNNFGVFVLDEFELYQVNLELTDELADSISGSRKKFRENGIQFQRIYLNNIFLKSSNALKNINTLFHEIKHVLQDDELEQYRIDVIKRLEDSILMGYIFTEENENKENIFYKDNYKYISVETDAEICSKIYLLKFLEIYAPITYRLKYNEILLKLQKNSNEEKCDNRQTLFRNINDLQILFASELRKHLEIIYGDILTAEQKIVLLQVYDTNGNPKTPDKYFNEKATILEQISKMPLKEEQALTRLKAKLDFYDGILSTFKYSREDLARNYLSLQNYKSTNKDITMEAMLYAEKIKSELEAYDQQMNLGGHK